MSNFDQFFMYYNPVDVGWTPILEDDSSNVATLSSETGTSLRWGNLVWITFGIVTSSIAGLTGTDALLIKGLPYSPSSGSVIPLSSLDNLSLTAGDSLPHGFTDPSNFPDAIAMQYLTNGSTTGDSIFTVDEWTNTGTVIGSGFYLTTD